MRENGVVAKKEVGNVEAAWVALVIQRRKSRGKELYADANLFPNYIYCAELPASGSSPF